MGDSLTGKRRVQLTGISTLSISLPKDWTRRFNIKKGTELSVSDVGDGSIVISNSSAQPEKEELHILVDEFANTEELRRKFISMYLDGCSTVHFRSRKEIPHKSRQAIITEVRRLIGMEVVDESPSEITIQDFFSHEGLSIEKSLRRANLLTAGMYEDFLDCLASKDASEVEKLVSRDDEIDRLKFLILRQIRLALKNARLLRELNLTTSDCANYSIVIHDIEHIADKITKSMKYFGEVPKARMRENSLAQIERMSKDVFDIYNKAMSSFLRRDTKSANQLIDVRKQLLAQQENLEKGLIKNPSIPFQYSMILECVMDIAEYSAEIAEVTINRG